MKSLVFYSKESNKVLSKAQKTYSAMNTRLLNTSCINVSKTLLISELSAYTA